METFSVLPALCAENLQVTGEFPQQRPVTRSFGAFFERRSKLMARRLFVQSFVQGDNKDIYHLTYKHRVTAPLWVNHRSSVNSICGFSYLHRPLIDTYSPNGSDGEHLHSIYIWHKDIG